MNKLPAVQFKEPLYILDRLDKFNRRTFTIHTDYEVLEETDTHVTLESNEGILTSINKRRLI